MVFHPIMEEQDTNLTAPCGKPCRIDSNTEACNSRVITPIQRESIKCTEDFIQLHLWGGDTQPSFTAGTGTCCFVLASSEWRQTTAVLLLTCILVTPKLMNIDYRKAVCELLIPVVLANSSVYFGGKTEFDYPPKSDWILCWSRSVFLRRMRSTHICIYQCSGNMFRHSGRDWKHKDLAFLNIKHKIF